MNPIPVVYMVDQLHDFALNLATQRARLESSLVAAILADPSEGMAVAESAGVNQFIFANEDLQSIYLSCHVGRSYPVRMILNVARMALERDGYRNWTAGKLEALANSHIPSAQAIRSYAGRLRGIDCRMREAQASFERASRLLSGDVDPDERIIELKRQRPVITLATRKRGAA